MNRSEQISDWYKHLQRINKDDKADFEVMLLDKNNTDDAIAAISGLMLNLLDTGYKEDVMLLLIDGTRGDNAPLVQHHALVEVIQMCLLFDTNIRHSHDVQEELLNMLEQHSKIALNILHKMYILNTRILRNMMNGNLKDTLIYNLIVVGEEAHTMFEDHSHEA